MPPVVTMTFAGALALVNFWLAARIVQLRHRLGVATGDGGDPRLLARMRAQSNFVEYVPIALVLMALIELSGGERRPLWLLGVLLVVGRLVHPLGMDAGGEARLRMLGMGLTTIVSAILVAWALYRAWLATHLGGIGVPVTA